MEVEPSGSKTTKFPLAFMEDIVEAATIEKQDLHSSYAFVVFGAKELVISLHLNVCNEMEKMLQCSVVAGLMGVQED